MPEPTPRRKHSAVMREILDLAGTRAADVGCGDGALVRFMTREGAQVIGIECAEAQLARARSAPPAGDECYLLGRAEALPLAAASRDLVVFFNSLHHVPIEGQRRALQEAARVLRPGGLLYAMEPIAEGRYFELMRPIEDETLVRAKAYEALGAVAGGPDFEPQREEIYAAPLKHDSFADWKRQVLAVDPGRRAGFEAREAALAAAFAANAERRDDAYWFDQPSRLVLLRRR